MIKKKQGVKTGTVERAIPLAPSGSRTIEALNHFRCEACNKWWTIGDAPLSKKEWFCPWCGYKQHLKIWKAAK